MNRPLAAIAAVVLLSCAPVAALASESFDTGTPARQVGGDALALQQLQASAQGGDVKAQFGLAQMYLRGDGAPKDAASALLWYRRAAEQGNPGAAFGLGSMYLSGQGAPRNLTQAMTWFRKSADQGYASAQVALGRMYVAGRGAPRDFPAAMALFRQAADQGDVDGQFELAELYAKDVRTPAEGFKDVMNAVFGPGKWHVTGGYRSQKREDELRAEGAGTVAPGERSRHSLGTPDAPGAYDIVVDGMSIQIAAAKLRKSKAPLARILAEDAYGTQGPHLHLEPYLNGQPGSKAAAPAGAAQDFTQAAQWYLKAADQGHTGAQLELARLYSVGLGVGRDPVQAARWRRQAAEPRGSKDAAPRPLTVTQETNLPPAYAGTQ